MPNWCSTNYVIEGSKDSIQKINNALENPKIEDSSSKDWEGNILLTLDIDPNKYDYMRGFINTYDFDEEGNILRLSTEEAWYITDFSKALLDNFPDLQIYYTAEEPGLEIYETNDSDGKYFPEKYMVDSCIEGNYELEYFESEKEVYDYIKEITDGKCKNADDVENLYNDTDSDDFIYIHEFKII